MNLEQKILSDTPDAGERLHQAIQMAGRAAADWEDKGLVDSALTIVCSSPKAGHVISVTGWPEVPEGPYDVPDMLAGLVGLIEQPVDEKACMIIAGVIRVMLGDSGCKSHLADVKSIRERGELPVLLFCIADAETILATSVAVSKPTLH